MSCASTSPVRQLLLVTEEFDCIIEQANVAISAMARHNESYIRVGLLHFFHRGGPFRKIGIAEKALARMQLFYEAASEQYLLRGEISHHIIAGMSFPKELHDDMFAAQLQPERITEAVVRNGKLMLPRQFDRSE